MTHLPTLAIYAACLASYNNGQLYGRWIDATQDEEAIEEQIHDMLASSPQAGAQDWAIHASEGFEGLKISEHEGIKTICEYAEFIQTHGELGNAILGYYCGELGYAQEAIENNYHGEWKSEFEFSDHLFDEIYLDEVPQAIHPYIDYELFCKDIFINDYFSVEANGKVHVFNYW